MLKIPFGKHRETGRFYDASSVPNGLKCNCICRECGTALEAVHPKSPGRQNYFRHTANLNCKGGLESLFHKVAKQILKENKAISINDETDFVYSGCDIETPRHGKQPDAYLSNEESSLIVEIFFWHTIEEATLTTYLDKGERVLEIDISGERKSLFDYERLKRLILSEAPRWLYPNEPEKPSYSKSEGSGSGWGWLLIPFAVIIGLIFLKPWKSFKRRKRRQPLRQKLL